MTFCVGQITSMYREELDNIIDKMKAYIEKKHKELMVGMTLFMLTDISTKTTELIYAGSKAEEIIKRAFKMKKLPKRIILEGVVSRKKQLIPALMLAIQEENI
jgi:manganese-dependent inorganic pyrophosphatase